MPIQQKTRSSGCERTILLGKKMKQGVMVMFSPPRTRARRNQLYDSTAASPSIATDPADVRPSSELSRKVERKLTAVESGLLSWCFMTYEVIMPLHCGQVALIPHLRKEKT